MKLWSIIAALWVLGSQAAFAQIGDPVVVDTTGQQTHVPAQTAPVVNPDQPPLLVCAQPLKTGEKNYYVLVADRETKTVAITQQAKGKIDYLTPVYTIASFKKNGAVLEFSLESKNRKGEVSQACIAADIEHSTVMIDGLAAGNPSYFTNCKVFGVGEYIKINNWLREQF